jgi:CDP-glycerol glycerophosphotransferase
VTVVITKVGGRPDELRSCLDSVVRSSYRNIEILVLIGRASRSLAAVLRSYARWDPRIRIVDEPTGSSPKSGSAVPNGDYLMVIEASERLEKGAVATLVKVLRLTESDFAVAIDDQGSNQASLMSADSARLDGMDCLGLTIATCPDHPAADSMSGTLFRHGFLTDLGWTVNAAPTIDQRHVLDRAYRWGRFDLVSYRALSRHDADVSHVPSPVPSNSHKELNTLLSDPSLRAKSNSQPA